MWELNPLRKAKPVGVARRAFLFPFFSLCCGCLARRKTSRDLARGISPNGLAPTSVGFF